MKFVAVLRVDMSEVLESGKPDSRIYYWWSVEIVLFSGFLSSIIAYFRPLLSVLLFGFLSVLGLVYTRFRYQAWSFELREDHFYIRYGVFRKVKVMAPFVRIQHVDTRRGPVARLLGLSNLVVYTAGSRGADVSFPGLLRGDADRMQEKLRDVAIESESSDAV